MITKKKFGLLYIVVLELLLLCIPTFKVHAENGTDSSIKYATTRAEMMKALSDKQEVIYIGDIEFDENDMFIQISQDVKFVGKPEGSLLKYAHFYIIGPEVESEMITVSFENIVFDGCYDMPSGKTETALSFSDFHGDRTDKSCIYAKGYLDFSFESCSIKNYCSKYGAAMYFQYTDGNSDMGTRAKLTIKNSSFVNNTCERGVLWVNGKKTSFYMSDCNFTANNAFGGIVMLGGINGVVENITIKDNKHVAFTEKNSFPQGGGGLAIVKSECVLKNSTIDGNETVKGGGVLITGSPVTIDSCKIINNHAEFGGGILIESGEDAPVYVTNCLISGNTAKEEGAVWVCPADEIGIGLPTGIVEFSFCNFENNISEDKEHFIFHQAFTENESTVKDKDGKIDFIACRIMDEKATGQLGNHENYNIINSNEKGSKIPENVVKKLANGYYLNQDRSFYAGINEKETQSSASGIAAVFLIITGISVVGLVFFVLFRARIKTDKGEMVNSGENDAVEKDSLCFDSKRQEKTENDNPGEIASSKENTAEAGIKTEIFLKKITEEGLLTGREMDVLREYISGKSRSEISEALFISESTVKNHISSIFGKTGVKNRKELLNLINNMGE